MNRNFFLLTVAALGCFMPSMARSNSTPPEMTKTALIEFEQTALLGDQSAARELWLYYSFGPGQSDPDAESKLNYWLQIAAENGGSYNDNGFSNLLLNYFSSPSNEDGIKNNFRSLYWAEQAGSHPDSTQIKWAANFDLFKSFPVRTNYWQGVASYFASNQRVANEAVQLETGGPSLISLNMPSTINQDNLPVLVVNALLGDAAAAGSVAKYFQTVKGADEFYWQTIAAEDGDTAGQLWLAAQLEKSTDRKDQIRAVFWTTKVSELSKNAALVRQAKELSKPVENKQSATLSSARTP